jgi:dienelactone hydrolase
MRDVNFAVPADEAFGLVRDWIAADASAPGTRARPAEGPMRLATPEAAEEPIVFGSEARLFGIVCRPTRPSADLPAVVFINTGANHHVGPNRMTVSIARRLAGLGVTSLRMDIAGIGESPARPGKPDSQLYALESCEDVRAALDWMGEEGFGRAVAIGLCCGAFIAFYTALRDTRLDGLVMANLQRFTWHEGDSLEVSLRRSYQSGRYYAAMARRSDTWRRVLRGDVNARGIVTALLRRASKRIAMRIGDWSGPLVGRRSARQQVVQGFRELSARGAETLLVYSASDGGLDELESYFGRNGRRLARLKRVRLEILDGADHTFTAHWARERYAERIEAQLHRVLEARRQRPVPAGAAAAAGEPQAGRPGAPGGRQRIA